MSHFSVLVITQKHHEDTTPFITEAIVDKLMAPYDETKEVKPYVSMPYAEVRSMIDTDYRKDSLKHLAEYGNAVVGKNVLHDSQEVNDAIDKALTVADNGDYSILSILVKEWSNDELDEHGNITSTYNKDAKWDWYKIGGRWDGEMGNDDNTTLVSELPEDFKTFAVVTPDGKWHGRGNMGWWGIVSDEDETYNFNKVIEPYQDYDCVLVDCHI